MKLIRLIGDWPNTYTYTKSLAEDLVKSMCRRDDIDLSEKIIDNDNINEQHEMLPVAIFRPAIVIPTYREPVSGWIDNMYGPTGIIVGVGAGLLRVFPGKQESRAELVPVDMVVNGTLACAWEIAQTYKNHTEPPVYNYVTSIDNPITWRNYMDYGVLHGQNMPMMKAIWYYRFTITNSRFVATILTFLYHILPALAIDTGLVIMGRKPK